MGRVPTSRHLFLPTFTTLILMLLPASTPVACTAPAPSPASLPAPSPSEGIKAGYWLSWTRSTFPPSSIDFSLFTHVFYAFVQPDPSTYEILLTCDDHQALLDFAATLHRQDPPLKALLSIGGAGNGTATFARMASNASTRAIFIRSAIAVARRYGLDGVDLDWEYPQDPRQMADLAHLYLEWRAAIEDEALQTSRPSLLLTSAVYFASHFFDAAAPTSYPVDAMRDALDFINAMSYDYRGAWDTSATGAPAALYDPQSNFSTSYGVGSWLAAGMPPEKVVMGLPMYGWTWKLKNPVEHGIGAPAVGAGPGNGGVLTYAEVVERNAADRAAVVYDGATVSVYSYASTVWIGYDDPRTVAEKVVYARRLGLGGYFFWALGYDRNDTIARTASCAWERWENPFFLISCPLGS